MELAHEFDFDFIQVDEELRRYSNVSLRKLMNLFDIEAFPRASIRRVPAGYRVDITIMTLFKSFTVHMVDISPYHAIDKAFQKLSLSI